MAINTLRNNNMVVANNEFPKRLKKGGPVKKADGGEVTDPLLKKTTPPKVVVTPAVAYDPAVYESALAERKGKPFPVNPKTGLIDMPSGALRTQVPALTTAVKSTQDYLFDYMKKNKKEQLSSAEADALLLANNMGSYNDYISKAKNLKAYRDLTVVPAKALNTTTEFELDSKARYGGGTGVGNVYTMQESTPFDSTHYEYTFPKNTYKQPPQKKAKGGNIDKGGIKGYIEGGNIQDETMVRGASARGYSKKPIDYARDTNLAILDYTIGHVDPNLIKDEDYKTKAGSKANQVSYGVNKIGGGIGQGIVDYYIPGLGTAIGAGRGAIAQEDKGLDASQKAKQDKAAGVTGMLGSVIGNMAGKKQNKGGGATEEVDVTSNIDENGIDTTTGEIAVYDTAPTQVSDGNNLTGQALNDWKSALTGEAKAQVLSKYNTGGYGYAKGGKIVGKGTGTSDSIPASLEDDGFVVPAVNAKLAEELRSKYLGDSKKKIASLKKGGVPVKVSNGEHYFTKAEKEILLAKGVDLNKLAPNADSKAELAKGGKVKAPYGYDADGKPLTMAESKALNAEMKILDKKQVALNKTATAPEEVTTQITEVAPISTTEAPAKRNPFQQMDIGKGVSLAQTGLGLSQLFQDGERPVDQMDAGVAKSVDEANKEAQFGISPLERRIANVGIDRNRNADVQTIINLSGGSAGTALANIRAASIASNEAKNNLSLMSEKLRLQKKMYADSKVSEKADRSKQLFNEKLNAFNVDQEAGAQLLGAGLRNVIGASRLDKELEAQKKREAMYNPTINIA